MYILKYMQNIFKKSNSEKKKNIIFIDFLIIV